MDNVHITNIVNIKKLLGGEDYTASFVLTMDFLAPEEGDHDLGFVTIDARDDYNGNAIIKNEGVEKGLEFEWVTSISFFNQECPYVFADMQAIEAFLQEVSPLLERVVAGYSTEYRDDEWWGTIDDDAQNASDEIQNLIDRVLWWSKDNIIDADEDTAAWLGWDGPEVTSSASDEDLWKMAESIQALAAEQGYYLHEMYGVLIDRRDALRDEEEMEGELI